MQLSKLKHYFNQAPRPQNTEVQGNTMGELSSRRCWHFNKCFSLRHIRVGSQPGRKCHLTGLDYLNKTWFSFKADLSKFESSLNEIIWSLGDQFQCLYFQVLLLYVLFFEKNQLDVKNAERRQTQYCKEKGKTHMNFANMKTDLSSEISVFQSPAAKTTIQVKPALCKDYL